MHSNKNYKRNDVWELAHGEIFRKQNLSSFKKWIHFLECSWNHEYFGSLAFLVKTLQDTRSIHDSINIPKIKFIAYIYILLKISIILIRTASLNTDSQWSKHEACFAPATRVWLAVNHNTSVTSGEWARCSKRVARASELGSCKSNLCNLWGYERLQKSKDLLKDCFENVYIV